MNYKETIEWYEIKTRPLTKEERESYGGEGFEYMFDCQMPADGAEILVRTYRGVGYDVCVYDGDCILLDNRGDWEDVEAWAYMPEGKRND